MSQTLDQKRGGPTQEPVAGPDPGHAIPVTGDGWALMIRRRKAASQ